MTVVTARRLQVDERGALVLAVLAGALLGLVPRAVSSAVAFEFAQAGRAGRDGALRPGLIRDAWAVAAALTALAGVPVVAVSCGASFALGWGWLGLLVVGASAVAYLASAIPMGVSLADGRMGRWAVAFAGSQCGALTGVLAVILLWTDELGPVAAGWALGSVAGALVSNDRESLGALLRGPRASTRRAQASFSVRASGAALLQTASGRADILLLGLIDGARPVGLYSVAVGASELVWFLGHSLATAEYGAIGRMEDGAARHATRRLGLAAAGPATSASGPAMAFVFGPEFRVSGDYLVILLIGGVAGAPLMAVTNYFANRLGRPGMALALAGVMLAVTAGAALVLIPPYGGMGAATASSIGYAAGLVYAVAAMSRRQAAGGPAESAAS